MKWLSNTYDPSLPDADMYVVRTFHETQQEAVQHHRDWLKGKIIGDPQSTTGMMSIEDMKKNHLVGVYVEDRPIRAAGRRR